MKHTRLLALDLLLTEQGTRAVADKNNCVHLGLAREEAIERRRGGEGRRLQGFRQQASYLATDHQAATLRRDSTPDLWKSVTRRLTVHL